MNFSAIKNLNPIVFYLISVICFVLANLVRDENMGMYYFLLVLGLVLFVIGLIAKRKMK